MKLRTKEILDYYLGNLLVVLLKVPTYCLGLFLKRDHALELRGEVAIIKLAGGGSLVIAYPALLGLRQANPDCRFVLITTPSIVPFGRLLKIFDEIRVINDRSLFTAFYTAAKVFCSTYRVDTIIDLETYSRLTTIFCLLTCARNRVSYFLRSAFWRHRISTHLLFFNRYSGSYYFYDQLCALYNAPVANFSDCRKMILGEETIVSTERRSADDPRVFPRKIGIGYACSELARERMMEPAQWLFFLRQEFTSNAELEIHFFGSSRDRGGAEQMAEILNQHFSHALIQIHCGELPLAESLQEMAKMNEFWGIDSALIHFSRMFCIPTTSFWGPTNPMTRLRAVNGLREKIYYEKISCSPCVHVAALPPCKGNNVCMKNLSVREEEKVENPIWYIK